MKIRIRDTGAVVLENEFRTMYPDTSFPDVLSIDVLDLFGADPVFEGPQPDLTANQYAVYAGVKKSGGKYYTKYEARDYLPVEIAARIEQRRLGMVVTPFQAKAALLQAGLLDDVEALISNPATDRLIVLAWQNVTEFRRLSPMVLGIAAELGLTDDMLDELFTSAAQITA